MRSYLKNLNIVEGLLVFREGQMIKITMDYFLKMVDKIVILFDSQDEETEKIVLSYKKKFPNKIVIGYSTIKKLTSEREKIPGMLNKRFKRHEGEIRQELLDLVKKEHEKKKIDILLWFDADEIGTNYFPEILEKFWKQDRPALMCNHIQMIDSFHVFHNGRFYRHAKAFKYRPDMTTIPMNARCLVNPFKNGELLMHGGRIVVHMADYNKKYREKRSQYKSRDFRENARVWRTIKDVRDLTEEEYNYIIATQTPLCNINDYL